MYILYFSTEFACFKETIQISAKHSTGEIYSILPHIAISLVELLDWLKPRKWTSFSPRNTKTFNVCTSYSTSKLHHSSALLQQTLSPLPFEMALHIRWTHVCIFIIPILKLVLLPLSKLFTHTHGKECRSKKQRHSHMYKREKKRRKKQALAKDINTWCVDKYKKNVDKWNTSKKRIFMHVVQANDKHDTLDTHTHCLYRNGMGVKNEKTCTNTYMDVRCNHIQHNNIHIEKCVCVQETHTHKKCAE